MPMRRPCTRSIPTDFPPTTVSRARLRTVVAATPRSSTRLRSPTRRNASTPCASSRYGLPPKAVRRPPMPLPRLPRLSPPTGHPISSAASRPRHPTGQPLPTRASSPVSARRFAIATSCRSLLHSNSTPKRPRRLPQPCRNRATRLLISPPNAKPPPSVSLIVASLPTQLPLPTPSSLPTAARCSTRSFRPTRCSRNSTARTTTKP